MAKRNLQAVFIGDTKSLEAAARRANKIADGFGGKMKNMGKSMTSLGKKLSLGLTAPIVAMGVSSVKAFVDFDKAMTNSTAIMGKVSKTMRTKMEAAAKDVAKTTTFSAEQAAESYFFLASAGLDAAKSIKALPVVAAFAQAGNFEMALATDLLTDAQSALGLTVDDTAQNMDNMVRVSDVLIKANTMSNATAEQFSEALTNGVGQSLKDVGKDLEEGIAVLAVFADQGIKGADAGTKFGIVMRDLQTKALDNEEAFKKAGVAVFDARGEMRNMADIVGDLEGLLDGMSDAQRKATLMALGFSDKSVKVISALLGTSGAIRDYEEAARDAGNTTEEVKDNQLESFAAKIKMIQDKFGLLQIEIVEQFLPTLELALKKVEKLVDRFDDLEDSQKEQVVQWGLVAAAVGPVLIVLGSLITAVGKIGGALLLLVSTPFTLLLMTLAANQLAVNKVRDAFGELPARLAAINPTIRGFLTGLAIYRDHWDKIAGAIQRAIDVVRRFFGIKNVDPGVGVQLPVGNVPLTGEPRSGGKDPLLPEGPAFADGGIVTKPTIALAGEAGPEAFIPLKNGKVPVESTGAEGAGISITINTDLVVTSDHSLKQFARRIGEALRQEDIRLGGIA